MQDNERNHTVSLNCSDDHKKIDFLKLILFVPLERDQISV